MGGGALDKGDEMPDNTPMSKSEWFENEDFWRILYPFLFPEFRMTTAPEEIEKILDLLDMEKGRALDLCCGPGRHTIQLAKNNLAVTGVDRSPYLLDKAKLMADEAHVKVEWVQEDMRRFLRPDTFDLIINLYTSFGYFESEEENLDVLRRCRENLKPGGRLVMEMMGKEVLARIYHPTISTELPDGGVVVQRVKLTHDWTRCDNDWFLIQDDEAIKYTFSHTIYSGRELKEMLLSAGFAEVALYGNFDGDPYDTTATTLLAVAKK